MVLSLNLQDFLLRARVLKLYRQALRISRRAPFNAKAYTVTGPAQINRVRFLIGDGLETLKRLDETLDMQGH